MSCPDAFKSSAGAFFAPGECDGCGSLKSERTSFRNLLVYFCQQLDSHSTCTAMLSSVIDGDTVIVDLSAKERVRLLGIDAPERSQGDQADRQCALLGVEFETLKILGLLAKIHLWGLCPTGSTLTLQTTGKVRDEYGRLLAGVFLGDRCLNRNMAEEGYALAYTGFSDWEDYGPLEQAARSAGRGIFGACEEPFYPASTRSYHRPGCAYAKYASARFAFREQAAANGLEPCAACLPDYSR